MSTLSRIAKRLKEPFPFYFNNDLENGLLILAMGLFTTLFLVIFQPFGHTDILTLSYTAQLGLVVIAGLGLNIFLLPRLIPALFDNWDIRKYIVFNIWNILLVGTLCGFHNNAFCPPQYEQTLSQHILTEIIHSFLIGVVPLFMMTFMIRNRILLENLNMARAANSSIDQFRSQSEMYREQYAETQRSILKASRQIGQQLKVKAGGNIELTESIGPSLSKSTNEEHSPGTHKQKTQTPVTRVMPRRQGGPSRLVIQSDTHESLDLAPESFLYAEAQDNYVKINWQENGELQSHLLRLSMKKLEFALGSNTIIRCHRSYLVNLTKVDSVRGNANGYRLHLGEARIPVSRSKGKYVLKSIDKMSLSRA